MKVALILVNGEKRRKRAFNIKLPLALEEGVGTGNREFKRFC